MVRAVVSLLLIAASTPVAANVGHAPARLELVCTGEGVANKQVHQNFNAWDNAGGSATGHVTRDATVPFSDQVNLWIEGGEGRLRMPRTMLPTIRGGENGWFKLKSISVGDREITASVAVNALNNPKVRIDRYTGAISISGKAGDFTGQCVKYDPATEQRAF